MDLGQILGDLVKAAQAAVEAGADECDVSASGGDFQFSLSIYKSGTDAASRRAGGRGATHPAGRHATPAPATATQR